MMSEKILLVDGHSIINRAFYGVTDLTNSEGLHTNAVFGFLNTLFKVLDEEKPDYVILAAAKVGGIHANDTYPADFIMKNLQIALFF